MRLINRWPEATDFELPKNTVQKMMNLITDPFDTENEAKTLWRQLGTALIVIDPDDTTEVLEAFSDRLVEQIRFALQYPESDDALANDYQLILSITNDAGGGFFIRERLNRNRHLSTMLFLHITSISFSMNTYSLKTFNRVKHC